MLLRKKRPPAITAITITMKTSACPDSPALRLLLSEALLYSVSNEYLFIFSNSAVVATPLCRGARLQIARQQSANVGSHYEITLVCCKLFSVAIAEAGSFDHPIVTNQ